MLQTDFDELQANQEAGWAEVRQEVALAPELSTQLVHTHEAVADLGVVEHSYQMGPQESFAANPLIVDQQNATRENALGAIQ